MLYRALLSTLIAAALLFSSCANRYSPFGVSNSASYSRYEPSEVQIARMRTTTNNKDDPFAKNNVTDQDVLDHADNVKTILRGKFTNARVIRQGSASTQVVLGTLAGASALVDGGATTAGLAIGSALIPQLGEIFDTGSRATAYQQAIAKIADAQSSYYKARASLGIPDDKLTPEGALLNEAVQGSLGSVEAVLAGMLPTLEQTKKAEAIGLKNLATSRMPALAQTDAVVTITADAPLTRTPVVRISAEQVAEIQANAVKAAALDSIQRPAFAAYGKYRVAKVEPDFAKLMSPEVGNAPTNQSRTHAGFVAWLKTVEDEEVIKKVAAALPPPPPRPPSPPLLPPIEPGLPPR